MSKLAFDAAAKARIAAKEARDVAAQCQALKRSWAVACEGRPPARSACGEGAACKRMRLSEDIKKVASPFRQSRSCAPRRGDVEPRSLFTGYQVKATELRTTSAESRPPAKMMEPTSAPRAPASGIRCEAIPAIVQEKRFIESHHAAEKVEQPIASVPSSAIRRQAISANIHEKRSVQFRRVENTELTSTASIPAPAIRREAESVRSLDKNAHRRPEVCAQHREVSSLRREEPRHAELRLDVSADVRPPPGMVDRTHLTPHLMSLERHRQSLSGDVVSSFCSKKALTPVGDHRSALERKHVISRIAGVDRVVEASTSARSRFGGYPTSSDANESAAHGAGNKRSALSVGLFAEAPDKRSSISAPPNPEVVPVHSLAAKRSSTSALDSHSTSIHKEAKVPSAQVHHSSMASLTASSESTLASRYASSGRPATSVDSTTAGIQPSFIELDLCQKADSDDISVKCAAMMLLADLFSERPHDFRCGRWNIVVLIRMVLELLQAQPDHTDEIVKVALRIGTADLVPAMLTHPGGRLCADAMVWVLNRGSEMASRQAARLLAGCFVSPYGEDILYTNDLLVMVEILLRELPAHASDESAAFAECYRAVIAKNSVARRHRRSMARQVLEDCSEYERSSPAVQARCKEALVILGDAR